MKLNDVTNVWTYIGSPKTVLCTSDADALCFVLGGAGYSSGGLSSPNAVSGSVLYNDSINLWRWQSNMPAVKYGGAGISLSNNTGLVVSGISSITVFVCSVYQYYPMDTYNKLNVTLKVEE
jgi:hypothetical protein